MKLRVLLVNPWIYDFAAFNLWSKPLGLLKIAEYLSAFDVEIFFIDCTDSYTIKKYGTGKIRYEIVEKPFILRQIPFFYKRYGISIDEFIYKLKTFMPFDVVFMTSIMSYWYPGVQKAIEIIKDNVGDVPIILGGIYATLYYDHASKNSGADFIYKGLLNEGLNFALKTFGFKLKKKRHPLRYYHLNLYESYLFAPLLSSEGCPFKCHYCASKILYGSYRQYPPNRILEEIMEYYKKGVKDFVFYDDALLVDANNHIKPLLQTIITEGIKIRFHTPNGLHARFLDEEVAMLMKKSGFRTIRLGLESVSAERQVKTGNKVSNKELEKAVLYLKRHGFSKENIGVYLMYGLPGQDIKEVREGIDFLKNLDVRIGLTEFSPIKGTEIFEELIRKKIINSNIDPILTNNTVFSYLYSGYDREELFKLKLIIKKHNEILNPA
jgi:radical SAM superfamily enzyme YgiQ (UPF0313 family)